MARTRQTPPPPPELREFRSVEEIDIGIAKLQRRINELEQLDIAAVFNGTLYGTLETATSCKQLERCGEVLRTLFAL